MSFDLTDPRFLSDPSGLLDELRSGPPLVRVRLPILGTVWLATTDTLVRTVLKDTERFVRDSANAGGRSMSRQFWWVPPFVKPLLRNVSQVDGDDHARLRRLVAGAFARSEIEALRPALAAKATALLAALPHDRPVDLVASFARPLPIQAICEMLGVPDSDQTRIETLAAPLGQVIGLWSFFRAMPALWQLVRYFRAAFEDVRSSGRPGLMRELLSYQEDGDQLSDDEVLAMVVALFIAGHETTSALIGAALALLLEDPELARSLRAEPDSLPLFLEEVTRRESPVLLTNMLFATRDTELGGLQIKKGDRIVPLLIAANRDGARFEDPDALVSQRRPNAHLGFGHGPHVCLGMQLARVETQEAVRAMLTGYPDARLAVAPGELPRTRRLGLRGFDALPVRLRG